MWAAHRRLDSATLVFSLNKFSLVSEQRRARKSSKWNCEFSQHFSFSFQLSFFPGSPRIALDIFTPSPLSRESSGSCARDRNDLIFFLLRIYAFSAAAALEEGEKCVKMTMIRKQYFSRAERKKIDDRQRKVARAASHRVWYLCDSSYALWHRWQLSVGGRKYSVLRQRQVLEKNLSLTTIFSPLQRWRQKSMIFLPRSLSLLYYARFCKRC